VSVLTLVVLAAAPCGAWLLGDVTGRSTHLVREGPPRERVLTLADVEWDLSCTGTQWSLLHSPTQLRLVLDGSQRVPAIVTADGALTAEVGPSPTAEQLTTRGVLLGRLEFIAFDLSRANPGNEALAGLAKRVRADLQVVNQGLEKQKTAQALATRPFVASEPFRVGTLPEAGFVPEAVFWSNAGLCVHQGPLAQQAIRCFAPKTRAWGKVIARPTVVAEGQPMTKGTQPLSLTEAGLAGAQAVWSFEQVGVVVKDDADVARQNAAFKALSEPYEQSVLAMNCDRLAPWRDEHGCIDLRAPEGETAALDPPVALYVQREWVAAVYPLVLTRQGSCGPEKPCLIGQTRVDHFVLYVFRRRPA
jgi:hypothetical protein